MSNAEKIAAAIERLAAAQERIAAILEDEAKIGGALWSVAKIADGIRELGNEVSALRPL